MCSLYGMYRLNKQVDKKVLLPVLTKLAFHSLTGGQDAGGVMWPEDQLYFQKWEGFKDWNATRALMNKLLDKNPQWIAGHCRLATHGKPSIPENNHPVVGKRFMAMHNGIINNHNELAKANNRDPKLVDSLAIVDALDKAKKIELAIEECNILEGTAACLIAAKGDKKMLCAVRFNSSPLHVAWVKDLNVLLLASHKDTIDKALKEVSYEHGLFKTYENKIPAQILSLDEHSAYIMRPTSKYIIPAPNTSWYKSRGNDAGFTTDMQVLDYDDLPDYSAKTGWKK